jgi:hypothetical protein
VRCYDAQVFKQMGIPRAFLKLAERRCGPGALAPGGARTVGGGYPDLSFLDELIEDPDNRPYTWDIPERGE